MRGLTGERRERSFPNFKANEKNTRAGCFPTQIEKDEQGKELTQREEQEEPQWLE
jgi:hypothetical protein